METEIRELLDNIDPAKLSYEEWLHVGMALHRLALQGERVDCATWEAWSRRDADRFHEGECMTKWMGFRGGEYNPITIATLHKLARNQDYTPAARDHVLGWDDSIGGQNQCEEMEVTKIVDPKWLEPMDVEHSDDWEPDRELIEYLTLLFQAEEYVGYVTTAYTKKGRTVPQKGNFDRTAGQLIELLATSQGDMGKVIGDTDPEIGAWIRFNPLNGEGVRDENVSDFRFALVESDDMDIEQQRAIYEELQLPIVTLVHSGNKSLHAIVRIEAADIGEYRKRVDFLYKICAANSLVVDRQNRNPSRLSRMPGVMRGGQRQWLVATKIGMNSWDEWREWIEAQNDDLPNPISLASVWDNLPALADPLIEGILRMGHKMLLAGPSKGGKSFMLIKLGAAIAEGRTWLGMQCAKGPVMYVNLELDEASALHRCHDVYDAAGWPPDSIANLDVWNLRGLAVPLDQLAPRLIRRASKRKYVAIIIDPIYKVLTGDENAADKMAHFCNQFDRICHELGAAVIYCHHHSKGLQGDKRSMDRASGSGVFGRDPDALLDMIELWVSDDLRKQQENTAICQLLCAELDKRSDLWRGEIGQDDLLSSTQLQFLAADAIPDYNHVILPLIAQERRRVGYKTAWRIQPTLREFPPHAPIDCWFEHPTHTLDTEGVLQDAQPEETEVPWKKGSQAAKRSNTSRRADRQKNLQRSWDMLQKDQAATIQGMANYADVSPRTIRNWIAEFGGYVVDGSDVREDKENGQEVGNGEENGGREEEALI